MFIINSSNLVGTWVSITIRGRCYEHHMISGASNSIQYCSRSCGGIFATHGHTKTNCKRFMVSPIWLHRLSNSVQHYISQLCSTIRNIRSTHRNLNIQHFFLYPPTTPAITEDELPGRRDRWKTPEEGGCDNRLVGRHCFKDVRLCHCRYVDFNTLIAAIIANHS